MENLVLELLEMRYTTRRNLRAEMKNNSSALLAEVSAACAQMQEVFRTPTPDEPPRRLPLLDINMQVNTICILAETTFILS